MAYGLQDLIDIQALQELQEKLYSIYSFPSAVIDTEGKILTAVAWQDVCTKFHRKNHQCKRECIKNDKYISEQLSEAKATINYQCPFGLVDNVTPIVIEDKHLANFFAGQFFLAPPDLEFFKNQAKEYGFNEYEYLEAIGKVPVWDSEKLASCHEFTKSFIGIIADYGFKSIKEKEVNQVLNEKEALNRAILTSIMDGFWLVGNNGQLLDVNQTYCQMSGYTATELLTMKITDLDINDSATQVKLSSLPKISGSRDRFVSQHRRKNGSVYDVETSVMFHASQGGTYLVFIRDITAQKVVGHSIRKLQKAIESSRASIVITGYDGNIEYANPYFSELTGYSPEEYLGKNPRMLKADYHSPEFYKNLWDTIKSGHTWEGEFLNCKKDGEFYWEKAVISPVKNEIGVVTHFVAVKTDITESKKISEELIKAKEKAEESRKRYKQIFESTGTANSIFDTDCNLILQNKQSIKSLGLGEEGAIGLSVFEIFGEKTGRIVFDRMKRVIETGVSEIFETEFTLITGKNWFRSTYQPIKDELGKVIAVQVISQDITEQKLSEIKLYESNTFLESILNDLQDAFFRADLTGRFTLVNQTAVTMYGYGSINELVGLPAETLYAYPQDRLKLIEELKTTGNVNDINLRAKRKDGSEFWVSMNVKFNKDISGNIIGTEGIVRDITERKQAEMELIKAKEKAEESNKLKSAFLNNISHEVRTPLNAILGFSQILIKSNTDNESRAKYVHYIEKSCDKLLNVVADVLELSQIQTNQTQIVENEICIETIFQELDHKFGPRCDEKKIRLQFNINLNQLAYKTKSDKDKLIRIFSQLLENAIKFTKTGSITINCQMRPNGFYEFSVTDTGIGISHKMQQKIFEPFRQVETGQVRIYGGSGIGLSIVKGLVELLGGEVGIESEPDKGSRFFFTVPFKSIKRTKKTHIMSTKKLSELTILVAEDEPLNFEYLEIVLSQKGCRVMWAKNGAEAVEMVKQHAPDLVLMDIKMPVMDGLEATQLIKKLHPDLPIIAQSAFTLSQDRNLALNAGCNDFLSKPIKPEELFNAISQMFL